MTQHSPLSRAALRSASLLIATDAIPFACWVCLLTTATIAKPSRSEFPHIHLNLKQVHQRQSSFTDEVTVIKGFWGFFYHLANFLLPWEIRWQDSCIVYLDKIKRGQECFTVKKRIFTLFHNSEEQLHFQTLITPALKTIHGARHEEQSHGCYMCGGEQKLCSLHVNVKLPSLPELP